MGKYFNAQQLDDLAKEIKTVPVDGEGRTVPVNYTEEFVRGTILKLISDSRQQQEWIATVIQNYSHVMTHDLCKSGAEMVAEQ